MSNKDPQPHHRPQQPGPMLDRELRAYPVAALQFRDMVEIPGRLTSQGLKSEMEQSNRKRWRITYVPQLRHVHLEYFAANSDKPESFYIHETHITWWAPAA